MRTGKVAFSILAAGITVVFAVMMFFTTPSKAETVSLTPTADSYMYQFSPNSNYGTQTQLHVYPWAPSYSKRSIIRFDFSSIPVGADISSATLYLREYSTYGSSRNIAVHRVTRDWSEGSVTWNSADGSTSWAAPGGDFNSTPTDTAVLVWDGILGWDSWDVTSDVVDFVNGVSSNYGWIVKDTVEDSSQAYWFFYSREGAYAPYIDITYSDTFAPVTEREVDGTLGSNGWYVSPVDITLTADDLESGVASINWQQDAGSWQSQTFVNTLNLAPNPSFEQVESPIRYWEFTQVSPTASGSRDTSVYKAEFNGNTSARIDVVGGTGYWNNRTNFVPASAGENFTVSVWARGQETGPSLEAYFRVFARSSSSGDLLLVESERVSGSSDWTRLAESFTVSGSDVYGIYVALYTSGGGGSVWFDGISINRSVTDTSVNLVVSSNGEHEIRYYSTDQAANPEAQEVFLFRIDRSFASWSNFTATQTQNDHTFIFSVDASDVPSGIDVSTARYQYSVDAGLNWGYYTDTTKCQGSPGPGNPNWVQDGWLAVSTSPSSPVSGGYGPSPVGLTTPETDVCNSNWAVCKLIRFEAVDAAGNTSQFTRCLNGAWTQTFDGDVYAASTIDMLSTSPDANSTGVIVASGPTVNNFTSSNNWVITNYSLITKPTFAELLALYNPQNLPSDDIPLLSGLYYWDGDLVLGSGSVPGVLESIPGLNIVIFVDGELDIRVDIPVSSSSIVLFIVEEEVEIKNTVTRVDASFIADEEFDTLSSGGNAGQLVINGMAAADRFDLDRSLSGGQNNSAPAEVFDLNPYMYIGLSSLIGQSQILWREVE